jgi:hypothetical protein
LPGEQFEQLKPEKPHASTEAPLLQLLFPSQQPVQLELEQIFGDEQVPEFASHVCPLPHVTHVNPLYPQWLAFGDWQVPLESQQPAHVAASQPLFSQILFELQTALPVHELHANPLPPHALFVVPATHLPFSSQHPLQFATQPEIRIRGGVVCPRYGVRAQRTPKLLARPFGPAASRFETSWKEMPLPNAPPRNTRTIPAAELLQSLQLAE